jgi:hypothetical protein
VSYIDQAVIIYEMFYMYNIYPFLRFCYLFIYSSNSASVLKKIVGNDRHYVKYLKSVKEYKHSLHDRFLLNVTCVT